MNAGETKDINVGAHQTVSLQDCETSLQDRETLERGKRARLKR